MGEITISTKEYKELIEAQIRITVFSNYVRASEFRINREDCARYLNFKLSETKSDDGDEK